MSGEPTEDSSAGTADSSVNYVVCLLAKEERKNPCGETGQDEEIFTSVSMYTVLRTNSHMNYGTPRVGSLTTSVQG